MSKFRTIPLVVIVLVALLLSLLLLTFCRGRRSGAGGESAGVVNLERQVLYPGASFFPAVDPGEGLAGDADKGALVPYLEDRFIYIAPLENGEDRYLLVDDGGRVVAEGSASVNLPPAAELEILELGEERLTARYGRVSVEAMVEDGVATAVFRTDEPDASLEVRLDREGRGELLIGQVPVDGYGAPSPAEVAALDALATGPLARAVTMVPLDLGCIEGAAQLPGQLHAALLLPWQAILKYEVARRAPVARHFLELSSCAFPGAPIADSDEPPNWVVLWDLDHAVPTTHLYFPLDGHGQMEPLAQ